MRLVLLGLPKLFQTVHPRKPPLETCAGCKTFLHCMRTKSLEQHFSLFLQQSTTYGNIQLPLLPKPNVGKHIVELLLFTNPCRLADSFLKPISIVLFLNASNLRRILLSVCYRGPCIAKLFRDYCVWSSIIDRFKDPQFFIHSQYNLPSLHFLCHSFHTLFDQPREKNACTQKPTQCSDKQVFR